MGNFSFQPKHILCAIDFSELSHLALKYAAVGAREFGSKLTVLHAKTFELPRYFTSSEIDMLIQELTETKKRARVNVSEHVKSILGSLGRELLLQYEVVETHPVEAILAAVEKESIDLIVMGTHGYGGLKRLLLGSVTENVVMDAKIPVFTVRQKEHDFVDVTLANTVPRIKRILCPCNISEVAGIALKYSVSLAERFHAGITVLYSVEKEQVLDASRLKEDLNTWISDTVSVPYALEPIIRKGNAAEQIIAHAREERDDLIILGAQHQSFLQTTFFGKTTDLVLRHAPVPVLITPGFMN